MKPLVLGAVGGAGTDYSLRTIVHMSGTAVVRGGLGGPSDHAKLTSGPV